MWPWEHLAVAYVLCSLLVRVLGRGSLSTPAALAVVAGSLLPDLVDKPLSWTVGLTSSYGLAHSVFVAPLLWLAIAAAAVRRGTEARLAAVAFALAHASHLATDVYDPTRPDRGVVMRVVLWPIAPAQPAGHGGLLDHVAVYFLRYVHQFLTDGLTLPVILRLALVVSVAVLWLADGAPIVADALRWMRGRFRT